jgi:hypothetical protein
MLSLRSDKECEIWVSTVDYRPWCSAMLITKVTNWTHIEYDTGYGMHGQTAVQTPNRPRTDHLFRDNGRLHDRLTFYVMLTSRQILISNLNLSGQSPIIAVAPPAPLCWSSNLV